MPTESGQMDVWEFVNTNAIALCLVSGLVMFLPRYLKEYIDRLYRLYVESLQSQREKLLQHIREEERPLKILELRLNEGENLTFYPECCELLVLTSTSEQAERALRARCCQYAHVSPRPLRLPHVEDGEVDLVVGTSTLCRCDDQPALLAEIYRVLAPNGKYIFLEHTHKGLNPVPYILKALASLLVRGCMQDTCHLTSDPAQQLRAAGFQRLQIEEVVIDAGPWPLKLMRNHVVGVAFK